MLRGLSWKGALDTCGEVALWCGVSASWVAFFEAVPFDTTSETGSPWLAVVWTTGLALATCALLARLGVKISHLVSGRRGKVHLLGKLPPHGGDDIDVETGAWSTEEPPLVNRGKFVVDDDLDEDEEDVGDDVSIVAPGSTTITATNSKTKTAAQTVYSGASLPSHVLSSAEFVLRALPTPAICVVASPSGEFRVAGFNQKARAAFGKAPISLPDDPFANALGAGGFGSGGHGANAAGLFGQIASIRPAGASPLNPSPFSSATSSAASATATGFQCLATGQLLGESMPPEVIATAQAATTQLRTTTRRREPLSLVIGGVTRSYAVSATAVELDVGVPVARPNNKKRDQRTHGGSPLRAVVLILDDRTGVQGLEKELRRLQYEAELSDIRYRTVLRGMMPGYVSEALMQKGTFAPEAYDSAVVLFFDIVGFTRMCDALEPVRVLDLLGSLFSRFDDILASAGFYRVDIIGDCYMAAGNIKACRPRSGGTAEVVADMVHVAHRMLEVTGAMDIPIAGAGKLRGRVGINAGPCIAGVVSGEQKAYSLFGDAVNVASRLESSSEPMHVNLNAATAGLFEEAPEASRRGYVLASERKVSLKGKGTTVTRFVVDPKCSYAYDTSITGIKRAAAK